MDYSILAGELLEHLRENSKHKLQRETEDFAHGEMSILAYLCFKEDGVCPGILCTSLGMTTPRISAAISSLGKKQLITRASDPSDRRKIHIHISETGRMLVHNKHRKITCELAHLLESLGEDDAREYVRIVGRISESSKAEPLI